MPGYSCSKCDALWPYRTDFKRCPQCDTLTTRSHSPEPSIPLDEALSLAYHARFERAYAEREQERIQRGDPSPDVLGRLDAQEMVEQVRAMERAVTAGAP